MCVFYPSYKVQHTLVLEVMFSGPKSHIPTIPSCGATGAVPPSQEVRADFLFTLGFPNNLASIPLKGIFPLIHRRGARPQSLLRNVEQNLAPAERQTAVSQQQQCGQRNHVRCPHTQRWGQPGSLMRPWCGCVTDPSFNF